MPVAWRQAGGDLVGGQLTGSAHPAVGDADRPARNGHGAVNPCQGECLRPELELGALGIDLVDAVRRWRGSPGARRFGDVAVRHDHPPGKALRRGEGSAAWQDGGRMRRPWRGRVQRDAAWTGLGSMKMRYSATLPSRTRVRVTAGSVNSVP